MLITEAAFDLIVTEEVTSEDYYNKHYRKPEWPGLSSGITIGVGYDACYSTPARLRADWSGKIPDAMIEALVTACGVAGERAKALLPAMRAKVDVPWDAAIDVFANIDVPRWVATVRNALPNTDLLSLDCLGALVSLAYNRGASFSKQKTERDDADKYREMRAIKAHMAAKEFDKIPAEFRKMKRLWPDHESLRDRREREAKLFEKGLKSNPVGIVAPAVEPHPRADAPEQTNPATSIDDAIARGTKKERAVRGAGTASTVTGGASKTANTVTEQPTKPILTPLMEWTLIGAGVGIFILGAWLIYRKRQQIISTWF